MKKILTYSTATILFTFVGFIVAVFWFDSFKLAGASAISYVRDNTAGLATMNASNTPAYMTFGTATTTEDIDAFAGGANTGFNTLALAVQMTATTGIPTLNIACESSSDNVDWYARDCYNSATTTNIANLSGAMSSYTWVFASSTCILAGGASNPTESVCERIFEIKPFSRFTRAVFTLASTTAVSTKAVGNRANIWAEFIGGREK